MTAKKAPRVRLLDTTFRDAQQSLLGGNLRGAEIVPVAGKMDAIGFAAMAICWYFSRSSMGVP